jgi:CheY-like chemotaxis protein
MAEANPIASLGLIRVLIVDDEDLVAEYFSDLLISRGCETTVYYDSTAALSHFNTKSDKYDLVISDFNMPNLNGACLAEAILNIKPDIPIILCSGDDLALNGEKIKSMGIKAFLQKPINSSKLLQIIDELKIC